jgi:hypothetical protein
MGSKIGKLRSGTVYCITRCEKIIEHTGTSVNIIYYIVALLQYEYTSKEIIISLIRPGKKRLQKGKISHV